jgi:hypothetical protein
LGFDGGFTEELPCGDVDLDLDLEFDRDRLFAGGVRLFDLDGPHFEADLPLRGGLLEDISIV